MISNFKPSYLKLHSIGELKRRADQLWSMLENCQLCPRNCKVNRLEGKKGICKATGELEISSYSPHFGEERSLVGKHGSGTIFFTHCNLRCIFCINWDISIGGNGRNSTIEELTRIMLYLQEIGCHNINTVTPTHYLPHILKALDIAVSNGLKLPLVYNTSGWEHLQILKLLDGIVDIYLPDFKYFDSENAKRYSIGAESYPETTKKAILEMHRQVGIAKPNSNGIMEKGLMIRHLVMPNNISGSKEIIQWIAGNLPKDTYVNIMSQYRPDYKALEYPMIGRSLKNNEYKEIAVFAKELGLTNLDIQGYY
ncbi:radical SAM protein [Bacteroidota bacterium]